MPRLIDDAGRVWHRLWSVRLSLLAGLASAADAGWEAHVNGQPRLVSIATCLISFGAAAARIVAQPGLQGDVDG
jgi:hypothetical protein